MGPNGGSIFSRSRCPGRRDLFGSIVFGGAKREGTAAVVVGAGLVVDARALLSVVVVGGVLEDSYCWLTASISLPGLDKIVSRR